MNAAKNMLFGIGWFLFGAILTSIDSGSLYWGAMVVGVIQFIVGLTQIGEKSEEEINAEVKKQSQARLQGISSDIAWDEIDVTDQQRIIMESVSELVHGFDPKLAELPVTEMIKQMQSKRFQTFKTLFEKIVPGFTSELDIFSIYKLGADTKQFSYIEQKIRRQNLQNDSAFGETLLKAMYFFAYSETTLPTKASKLIRQIESLFGFDEAKIGEIQNRVRANLSTTAAVQKSEVETANAHHVADAALANNQPVSKDIAAKVTTLRLQETEFSDTSLLAPFKNLKTLYAGKTKVHKLTGVEHLTHLEDLYLFDCPIEDISNLAGLHSLRNLSLDNTEIQNIEPLSNLENLESLTLGGTNVTNLTAVAGLTNLLRLDFEDCTINDITPLQGLTRLRQLDLSNNPIENIEPLQGMLELEDLVLNGTEVSTLSAFRKLKNLKKLYLSKTKVVDLSPLFNMSDLSKIDLSKTPVDSLEPLIYLSSLSDLNANGTAISGALPEFTTRSLWVVDLSDTKLDDISGLKSSGLRRVYLQNTQVSDVSSLLKKRHLKTLALQGSNVADAENLSRGNPHRGRRA